MKKQFEKALAVVLSAAVAVSGAAVANNNDASAKAKKVKKVTVKTAVAKTLMVKVKKTAKLKVKVAPKGANKAVSYKVANKKIAKVSKKGVVKGLKYGKTKVTVTSKANKKKKVVVTVYVAKKLPKKVTKINGAKAVTAGAVTTLTAKVNPKKADLRGAKWTLNKAGKKAFKINKQLKNGKVKVKAKANKAGKSGKITFTTANGKKKTVKLTNKAAAVATVATSVAITATKGSVTTSFGSVAVENVGYAKVPANSTLAAVVNKNQTVNLNKTALTALSTGATRAAAALKSFAAGTLTKDVKVGNVELNVKADAVTVKGSGTAFDKAYTGLKLAAVEGKADTYKVTFAANQKPAFFTGNDVYVAVENGTVYAVDNNKNYIGFNKDAVVISDSQFVSAAYTK